MKWLVEKGYANSSFLINMIMTSRKFKGILNFDFDEDFKMLKEIVAELEPKN
jgi:hypothetical protein